MSNSKQRRRLVLAAISVCAACALLATPAFADDGKGGGGDNHARVTTTTAAPAQPRDDRGRGDDRARPAANANADPVPPVVHVEHEAEAEHQVEVEHVAAPPVVNVVVDNRGPGNAFDQEDNRGPGNARDRDNDDNDEVAAVATVNDLVNAINNQVATLTNAVAPVEIDNEDEVDEANQVEVEVEHLRVVSLANLTAGLSAADAAAITNAVNANMAALQGFLASGGANANAIDNALNAISIAPSSVLAILSDGEHLVVVTA